MRDKEIKEFQNFTKEECERFRKKTNFELHKRNIIGFETIENPYKKAAKVNRNSNSILSFIFLVCLLTIPNYFDNSILSIVVIVLIFVLVIVSVTYFEIWLDKRKKKKYDLEEEDVQYKKPYSKRIRAIENNTKLKLELIISLTSKLDEYCDQISSNSEFILGSKRKQIMGYIKAYNIDEIESFFLFSFDMIPYLRKKLPEVTAPNLMQYVYDAIENKGNSPYADESRQKISKKIYKKYKKEITDKKAKI